MARRSGEGRDSRAAEQQGSMPARPAAAAAAARETKPSCGEKGSHRHGLPAKDDEVVGALHQEAREFAREDRVHLVELLDFDADSYGVDRSLNHDALMLGAVNDNRIQKELLARPARVTGEGPRRAEGQQALAEGPAPSEGAPPPGMGCFTRLTRPQSLACCGAPQSARQSSRCTGPTATWP